jgi:hypothetical protein
VTDGKAASALAGGRMWSGSSITSPPLYPTAEEAQGAEAVRRSAQVTPGEAPKPLLYTA